MSTVRLRRLQSDYSRLHEYAKQHPRLQIVQAEGDPPERYQLEYRINSLRQKDDQLEEVKSHLVEVLLPRNYPRTPPQCRMLTPIFHPNIAPHAICIGDHWSAGASLDSVVARIGEMIAYQSYNTKSPLNGEAARWVDQNLHRLPLDSVSMVVEDKSSAGTVAPQPPRLPQGGPPAQVAPPRSASSPAARQEPAAAPPPLPTCEFKCPHCESLLRIRPEMAGKRVRCPRCQNISTLPADLGK